MVGAATPWDFRSSDEQLLSKTYEETGFVIQNGNHRYLELLKHDIEKSFMAFTGGIVTKKLALQRHIKLSRKKAVMI